MNPVSLFGATVVIAALPTFGAAQATGENVSQPVAGAVTGTRIAVIDIDRVAAESAAGKALFERLKQENDRLAAERAKREQEIRDEQAKLGSDVLSADARDNLSRKIERLRTDAQRWLEDAQREFQEKQEEGEAEFQQKLGPVVESVARENGIGLIFRATPGLTFVLDPNLDITPLVIEAFNKVESAPPGGEVPPEESNDPLRD